MEVRAVFITLICIFVLFFLFGSYRSLFNISKYVKTYDVVFRNENDPKSDITLKAFEDLGTANVFSYVMTPGQYHVFAPKGFTIIGSHSILLSTQCNCILSFENGKKRIYLKIRT